MLHLQQVVNRCAYCGGPATLACDFVLGGSIVEWSGCSGETALKVDRFDEFVPGKGLPCWSPDRSELFTCDAPLCERCAIHKGNCFYGEFADTVDWCPCHIDNKGARPMMEDEAERIRLRTWKLKATG